MTPVKAAADEVRREEIAEALCCPEGCQRPGKCVATTTHKLHHTKDQIDAIMTIFSRAPAGNDGVREALVKAHEEMVLAMAYLGRDAGTDRIAGTIKSLTYRFAKADAAILAALSLPQAQNTIADSSGSNPGAIGASKEAAGIAGFATVAAASTLPQAREAGEPVAPGKIWDAAESLRSQGGWRKVAADVLYEEIVRLQKMVVASPPPIPDAAVGREKLTDDQIMQVLRKVTANQLYEMLTFKRWKDGIDITRPTFAAQRLAEEFRALKPQDTGSEK